MLTSDERRDQILHAVQQHGNVRVERLARRFGVSAVTIRTDLRALTAAGLAALGQAWSTAAQREKERELAFRGGEIARARRAEELRNVLPPAKGRSKR